MIWMILAMLLILAIAGAVVAYVAFPHRGADLPVAPRLGDAVKRHIDALPTLGGQHARR